MSLNNYKEFQKLLQEITYKDLQYDIRYDYFSYIYCLFFSIFSSYNYGGLVIQSIILAA